MKGKLLFATLALTASSYAMENKCEIVVYQRNGNCYVEQDKDGCLIIGKQKPKCDQKGRCVIKDPDCNNKKPS